MKLSKKIGIVLVSIPLLAFLAALLITYKWTAVIVLSGFLMFAGGFILIMKDEM